MSTTIDQRIVEMRFDNKQFEQNVSDTLSSIDKLKQGLKFEGASKGLSGIEDAARKVNMNPLTDSVQQVGLKFNWLYTYADQTMRNITNTVNNAATRIVKAFTIDPVKTGFSEYETQINAVQTILANTKSKGTTLDDVNGALDELNAYADKTIYNFTEMTRNIGTFTAAGVDLDTSVAAIKGIANLAAVSGSTSQQASTAMYQLSQALSSGTVKLMDWNSVVNAGMGGQVFQDALKETARVHGIAIDELIKQEGSFRETLSHGWLSSEILTETLSKFTGDLNEQQLKTMGYTDEQIKGIMEMGQTANDAATKVKTFSQLMDTLKEAAQSGWTSTWEIIVGDFEEAKELLTNVSNVLGEMIGNSAESRNELLENWKVLGGRTAIIDAIKYAFQGFVSMLKAIGEAWREVFPPMTAERLVAISEKIRDIAKSFDAFFNIRDDDGKIVGMTKNFENLKRTFKGIFAVVKIVTTIFKALFKALGTVLGVTGTLGGGLLSLTATIGDWLVMISDAIVYSGIFENVFVGIAKIIKWVIGIFGNFAKALGDSFLFDVVSEGLSAFLGLLVSSGDATERFAQMGANVKEAWINSGLYSFLMKVWKVIATIGNAVGKVFKGFFGGISDAFATGDFTTILEMINALLSGGLILALGKFIKTLTDLFGAPKSIIDAFKDITTSIDDIIGSVGDTFKAFQDKLRADALKSIATAILILAGSLVILSFIDEEKLSKALAAITILMAVMTAMMAILSKGGQTAGSISKSGITFSRDTNVFVSLGLSLLMIAGAIAIFANMDTEKLKKGLLAASAIIVLLGGVQLALAKFGGGNKVKGATWLVAMGLSLILLATSMRIIAGLDWEDWAKGLIGVIALLGALGGIQILYSKLGGGSAKMLAGAVSIAIIATSLNALIPILVLFALLPTDDAIRAVTLVTVLLAALGAVQILYGKLGNGWSNMSSGAAAIAVMADSLNKLLPLLIIFAIMPLGASIKAVGMLTVILAALAGVQVLYGQLGKGAKNMLSGATAITIIANSLNLLLPILLIFALLDTAQVLQSVLGFTAILAAMGGAIVLLGKLGGGPVKMIASAKALLVMATALLVLAPAILMLGSMSVGSAIMGITTLAAALAVVVGIAVLINVLKVAPTLMAFASAVMAIGMGTLVAGAGLLLFGVGLSAVALGVIELVGALTLLVGSLGTVAVGLTVLVAAVIEGIIRGIGAGLVALCDVIIEALPLLADVCIELIKMLCDVLVECVPMIVDACLVIILKLCESLDKFIPPIVSALVRLISGIIEALTSELPRLVDAVVDLLFVFIQSVINAIGDMDASGLADALKNVGMLALILAALAAMKLLAPAAMVGVLAMAVVVTELALVLSALSLLSGLSGAIEKGGKLLGAIGSAFGQFIGGLIGGFAKGATEDLPEIAKNLSEFARNIEDFVDIAPKLAGAMASLAGSSILGGLANLLTGKGLFGGSAMKSFKKDLIYLGEGMAGFSDAIGGRNLSNMDEAAKAAKALTGVANALPDVGWLDSLVGGSRNMDTFGKDLGTLGAGLASFSDSIGDRDFNNVSNAVTAAKGLVELSNNIPDNTGLMAWITGDTAISLFGEDLAKLGKGIAMFAKEVNGVPDVSAAVNVGKGLVELTNKIPNEGGMASWFTGDNSISKFAKELAELGVGITSFANNTKDINAESVTAAVTAAQGIVDMTNKIPNEGGMKSWFTGESSLSKFSTDIGNLGLGIRDFAVNTAGIAPETVKAAAEAAILLAGIMDYVPNEGGMKSWFTGESSLSKFGTDLGNLGLGIRSFSVNTEGISPETVKAAAEAAISLAGIMEYIPNEGGMKSWFTGEASLSKFGSDLEGLGKGLNLFSTNVTDVDPAKVASAAEAAKKIADMTGIIPSTDGIKAWFTGEVKVSKWADQLPALGAGLAGFAQNVGTAEFNLPNIQAAATAGKSLAEMTQFIPKEGGIKAWFTGETSFAKFAENLPDVAKGVSAFAAEVAGKDFGNVEAGANAAKTLAEMTDTVPKNSDKIVKFGSNLGKFGDGLKDFATDVVNINDQMIAGATTIVKLAKEAAAIDSGKIKDVAKALEKLTDAVETMAKDIKADMKTAGKEAIEGFIKGIDSKIDDVEDKAEEVAEDAIDAISSKTDGRRNSFYSAGKDAVSGFANGMDDYKYKAENAAKRVARAALDALRRVMDSHSPSRETEKLGVFGGMGFVNGLSEYASDAGRAGYELGDSAKRGLRNAISKVQDFINTDIDSEPTIRPVLDLSDVESRAGLISGLFGNSSVGVRANIGAINSMMNSRNQNGTTNDVIDAIKELREDMSHMGNTTYNIDGVTYDDGSNIAEAVETLIRAAKIERRV